MPWREIWRDSAKLVEQRITGTGDDAVVEERVTYTTPEGVNAEVLRDRIAGAISGNRDFLGAAPYTSADIVAQVRVLTRNQIGLLRLEGRALDGTD